MPCAASGAVSQTISFDDLAPGTVLGEQYRNVGGAGQGVIFDKTSGTTGQGDQQVQRLAARTEDVGALSRSPVNVAQIEPVCPGNSEFPQCPARAVLSGTFLSDQRGSITIFVGASNAEAAGRKVTFTGYDEAGTVVDVAEHTLTTAPTAYRAALTLSPGVRTITSFTFAITDLGLGSKIGFDDFAFQTPDPAAPPDPPRFALATGDAQVGLLTPGSATVQFNVNRRNNSHGAMHYSIHGMPPGVTFSFAPPVPTDAATVRATLTARAGVAPGDYRITVRALPVDLRLTGTGNPDSFDVQLQVRVRPDPRIDGIEVTQGIQSDANSGFLDNLVQRLPARSYRGVPLAAHGKTIVRVFGSALLAPAKGVAGVSVALYGSRDGVPLPDSPLMPSAGPLSLGLYPRPPLRGRAGTNSNAYTFTLPDSWTEGKIKLEAKIISGGIPGVLVVIGKPDPLCDSDACVANDSYALTDIAFTPMREVTLRTLMLAICQPAPKDCIDPFAYPYNLSPKTVFAKAAAAVPVRVRVIGFSGMLNVTDIADLTEEIPVVDFGLFKLDPGLLRDIKIANLKSRIADWKATAQLGTDPWFRLAGVQLGPGTPGNFKVADAGFSQRDEPVIVVDPNNPLLSVAHELVHALGVGHASSACGAVGDQAGVPWPPDNVGFLQGIGVDRSASPPYPVIADQDPFGTFTTAATIAGRAYDFMSYCAPENRSWLSPRNWTAIFDAWKAGSAARSAMATRSHDRRSVRAAQAQGSRVLHVEGVARGEALVITDISPQLPSVGSVSPGSPFHLVARDAGGQTLADVSMRVDVAETHGSKTTFVEADVPFYGAAAMARVKSVQIASGPDVSRQRTRSANAPVARFVQPRRGATVGRKRTATIRWSASDADRDVVTTYLDYSPDAGRHWRSIYSGTKRTSVKLRSSLLSRSRAARLRLRVNDGFNESTAISARFTALGAPPAVTIASPLARERVRQDAATYLSGSAVDDSLRTVRGTRLTWFVGKQRLGRGEKLSVTDLPAGRRVIRLVARDGFGRQGSASISVSIAAAKPRFLVLRAPPSVRRSARRVRLLVAATVRTTLRVGRQRFSIGRHSNAVVVRVKPGRQPLSLQLRLAGGRLSTRSTLTIPRR